jgi:hypothetical protein
VQVRVSAQDVRQRHRVDVIALLAADNEVRSRYRATASGLIGKTGRPLARSTATSSPRGVSIATGIGASGLSPAAASIAVNSATPSTLSSIRRFAIRLPSPSISAMS